MPPKKPITDPAAATPPHHELARSKPRAFPGRGPCVSDEVAGSDRPIPLPVSAFPTALQRPGDDPMPGPELMAPPIDEMDFLRQQLLQAQRLSSVGALASSVAHEFNNILTTIINYAKLGQKALPSPVRSRRSRRSSRAASGRRPSSAACSASRAINRIAAKRPTLFDSSKKC